MVKLKGKLFYMKREHFISDLCRKEPSNLRSELAAKNDTLSYLTEWWIGEWRDIRRREMTEYPKIIFLLWNRVLINMRDEAGFLFCM